MTTTYSDISTAADANPFTGDITRVTEDRAIKQSVINLVKTNPFERYHRSNIKCKLRSLLFEPDDPITRIEIRESIVDVLTNHEPRVVLYDVEVSQDQSRNGYSVSITYGIKKNTPSQINVDIFLERLR